MRVIGAAADQPAVEGEIGLALAVEPGHHLDHLLHDLGADAVAGEKEEFLGHLKGLESFSG